MHSASLGILSRRIQPYLTLQAVTACVLRKVYYDAETDGQAAPALVLPEVLNLVRGHHKKMSTVILTGAQAVLPVWSTTPVPILYH
jgi:hypothetical protein